MIYKATVQDIIDAYKYDYNFLGEQDKLYHETDSAEKNDSRESEMALIDGFITALEGLKSLAPESSELKGNIFNQKVINIEDFKTIENILKVRIGNKFIIGYMDGDTCHTYLSDKLTDMEVCYIADTINHRREL